MSTRQRHELKVRIALRGPVLVRATAATGFGMDAAVARDEIDGCPVIPGSLVKGKVREALEQLSESPLDIAGLLGEQSDSDFGRKVGRMTFGELRWVAPTTVALNGSAESARGAAPSREAPVQRIAVDPDLQSAEPGMLRVIEAPFRPGSEMEFSGTAHCFATDCEIDDDVRRIQMALRWCRQVGSLRTTGFGRLISASVERLDSRGSATDSQLTNGVGSQERNTLEIRLRPTGPLCLSRHPLRGNLFVSDDQIPGSAIAGAVMEAAKQLGIEIDDFNSVRFRHAMPTVAEARPQVLALSTVRVGRAKLYDVSTLPDPVLLQDENGRWRSPAFPIDWKDSSEAMAVMRLASPARSLRVRTRIDRTKRAARREKDGGELFAYEHVLPRTAEGKEITWRACIDLGRCSCPAKTAEAIATVLHSLAPMGKSKTVVEATVTSVTGTPPVPSLSADSPLALALQTPALLADPRYQEKESWGLGPVDQRTMHSLYDAVWRELSDESLGLSHQFSQHMLAGGEYLAARFRGTSPYEPWLLTCGGSVFVFKVIHPDKAAEKLRRWLSEGLSLPGWAREQHGATWEENPYIPENGYGEVAVHTPRFPVPTVEEFKTVSGRVL